MTYETFAPHPDLASVVKCYWTLEVPAQRDVERQLVIPDGCIEMAFLLADDIKRYTEGDEFVLQPRDMILGQITRQFTIEPTGTVSSFAVRFYPYGFANFVDTPIERLANTETPLDRVFGEAVAASLAGKVRQAPDTQTRIAVVEDFLLSRLGDARTIDAVVRTTVEAMFATKGSRAIKSLVNDDAAKRRKLEREFRRKIGMSPKQLGKVIRLQTALKLILNRGPESLTDIAYESEYYDQAHFIKDFREFTGITPKSFLGSEAMALSSVIYK